MFSKARLAITSLAVVIALLAVVTVVYAAMYVINTNDGSAAEWSSQGINSFQADPASDVVTASVDILETWVARSLTNTNRISPTINFLMRMNSGTPLQNTANLAVAILDCDNDNDTNFDANDRLIAYVLAGGTAMLNDAVYIGYGDYSNFWYAGESETEDHNLGQVVGSFVEWGVPLSDIDQTPGYCQDTPNVRFATVRITVSGFPSTIQVAVYDQIPTFRGYNVPTAVQVETLEAHAQPTNVATLGLALGMAVVLGVVVVTRSRRQ